MAIRKRPKIGKIEIDPSAVNGDSPDVRSRLERIERNYGALDQILAELESKIKLDDRLAVNDSPDDDLPKKPR